MTTALQRVTACVRQARSVFIVSGHKRASERTRERERVLARARERERNNNNKKNPHHHHRPEGVTFPQVCCDVRKLDRRCCGNGAFSQWAAAAGVSITRLSRLCVRARRPGGSANRVPGLVESEARLRRPRVAPVQLVV